MLRRDMKRKRRDLAAGKVVAMYRPSPRPYKRRRFTPGTDRVGGYYGRYSGRNAELKFHDFTLDDSVILATGQITNSVNLIAQGITESTRIGRKCTIRSIQWRYRVELPKKDAQATPAGGDSVRIIMYIDKQCNGATAVVQDILETGNWQSFRFLANSGRFVILMDRLVSINYSGMGSDGAGVVSQDNVFKDGTFSKQCNVPLEFDNTAGAITEIRSNNIGTLILAASGVAGFKSNVRLRFSDS